MRKGFRVTSPSPQDMRSADKPETAGMRAWWSEKKSFREALDKEY